MEVLILANAGSEPILTERLHLEWTRHLRLDARKSYDPLTDKGKGRRQKNDLGTDLLFISSQEHFNAFDRDNKQAPGFIIIVPELNWSEKDFEGYELAKYLLERKYAGQFFNLLFLSVLDRPQLLAATSARYHGLTKTFYHRSLLDGTLDEFFKATYSEIHFTFIRSLILSNEGRLSSIEHELSGIAMNVKQLADEPVAEVAKLGGYKKRLLQELEELSVMEEWMGGSLDGLKSDAERVTDKKTLQNVLRQVQMLIDDLKLQQSNGPDVQPARKKSPYRVLIIEDDQDFRRFFVETFNDLFVSVQPSIEDTDHFDIGHARNLVENGTIYDVLILDLLYKDKLGNWLLFNGLDLYQLARKKNPDACIRIITSLPRDIVAKTSTILLGTSIPIGHIFTKKNGLAALKYIIQDRAAEIAIECAETERARRTLKLFPKEGLFKKPGVPTLMMELVSEGEIKEYADLALHFFDLYKDGKLTKDTQGWNKGELPSPKNLNNPARSYILKRLPTILGYRLIVLYFAVRDPYQAIDSDFFVKNVLPGIAKAKTFQTGAINTKLGFNDADRLSNDDINGYQISFTNLFAHEVNFISEHYRSTVRPGDEQDEEPLLNWLKSILLQNEVYQNWQSLDLDFLPYDENALEEKDDIELADINIPLTVDFLGVFLQRLLEKSTDRHVQKIIDAATGSYEINEDKVKLRPAIAIKVHHLFAV